MIHLRPKHVLCLVGFNREWYDEKSSSFIESIRTTIDQQTIVKLIVGPDDFCRHCVHRSGDGCGRKVGIGKTLKDRFAKAKHPKSQSDLDQDNTVLTYLGAEPLTPYRFAYIIQTLYRSVQNKSQLESVCGQCQFRDTCTFYTALH